MPAPKFWVLVCALSNVLGLSGILLKIKNSGWRDSIWAKALALYSAESSSTSGYMNIEPGIVPKYCVQILPQKIKL